MIINIIYCKETYMYFRAVYVVSLSMNSTYRRMKPRSFQQVLVFSEQNKIIRRESRKCT
jgi:hypothetical protein